ncbi:amino acid ABC transporter ATP-binding/permease protein [Treponema pectinovorum]|uniref:amino acid ABC transporter ATP-binding/permease protein n=1 Tax=Treponema pectinovorum TaxID=164 RepID=UPI0021C355DD|nr:ABC transporter ATP-binding protein [Treponema pectinovorum]
MKTLLRLSKLVAPLFPIMILAIIFGTLGFLCAIGIPVFAAIALVQSFPVTTLVFLGIARGVLHYIEQYCNHFIAFTLLARIRNVVFSKLRSLGPSKLEGKEKGNLIALLTSDIELLEVFYAHTISPVCIAFLVCGAMVCFIGHYSVILGILALLFYCIVGILVPALVSKPAVKHGTVHRKQFADMNSFLLDCLRGLSISIMYATGAKKLFEIETKSDNLAKSQNKMAKIEGLTAALSGLFVTLGSICMLFVSLAVYKKGLIGFDAVIICTTAMFSSFGPVIAVANLGSGLSQTIASGERVLALLDEKPIVEEVKEGKKIVFEGANAQNVSFKYPSRQNALGIVAERPQTLERSGNAEDLQQKPGDSHAGATPEFVLKDVSIEFPKNSIIGIQGKSGSGKSTLLKLFMHFWEANSGKVLISGVDVKKIQTENLRKIESYVTQETVLFHDTIAENIRIAKLDASDEEIIEACKKASIDDFIQSLPQKYDTLVSELGDNFSGGERQRLGLARAFLHRADFMLLDEPTSNLDLWNEEVIMNAVKADSKEKTVIIVSHRDSTFNLADKVIKLESGRKS